jgi:hypothetical protein
VTTRSLIRTLGVSLTAPCLAAAIMVTAPAAANAATGSKPAATTSTTASRLGAHPATASVPAGVRAATGRSPATVRLTFTPIRRAGPSPQVAFTCTVTFPAVTDIFATGQISWSAAVGCSTVLRLQGLTALYHWGSTSVYAFGTSYDNYNSYETSSGSVSGIHGGAWGVNNNVLIFVPSGYTSTPGPGCYHPTAAEIHCTATTGPFTAG